jgi:hypothetical protein
VCVCDGVWDTDAQLYYFTTLLLYNAESSYYYASSYQYHYICVRIQHTDGRTTLPDAIMCPHTRRTRNFTTLYYMCLIQRLIPLLVHMCPHICKYIYRHAKRTHTHTHTHTQTRRTRNFTTLRGRVWKVPLYWVTALFTALLGHFSLYCFTESLFSLLLYWVTALFTALLSHCSLYCFTESLLSLLLYW